MKTRIVSGVIGAVLLIALLWQPYAWVLAAGIAVLCALSSYELTAATGLVSSRWMQGICIVAAATVPFWCLFGIRVAVPCALAAAVAVGVTQVMTHERQSVTAAVYAVAMSLWAALAMSCIVYLRTRPVHGGFLTVWLLLIPWMSDTGAYFTGMACGKHKLCPNISPKKTVEGLLGGLCVSAVLCAAAALVYRYVFAPSAHINWVVLVVITLIGAGLSVFGDLLASLIKRQTGIKDFGNIMPGHGGVMDRFDSLLLTAPTVCLLVRLWPVIT